jgi:hypothetical protein
MGSNIFGIRNKEDPMVLTLPLILAGPILRRADTKQVYIWIACNKPVNITAKIFRFADLKNINQNKLAGETKGTNHNKTTTTAVGASIIGIGDTKSLRLGERLHIALVSAHPFKPETANVPKNININNTADTNFASTYDAEFPTDELLAYDIEITYNNGQSIESRKLKDLGLIDGKNSIAYNDRNSDKNNINNNSKGITNELLLPTFFLRGQKTSLSILHGSCRKLHGKGVDCLAAADELISSSVDDLHKRPSSLFLTGDQIYADDVSSLLIQHLTQLSIKLMGYEEEIEGINRKLSEIGVGERQELVQKYAGFTSENAGNHLLSFGEYSAMHILAWNSEIWPQTYPNLLAIASHNKDKNKKYWKKQYFNEIKQLEKARNALPAIRRVFANTPIYMVCDDHDITDDWNITKEWYEAVRSSTCGKQIVTNGLAAYWAFQAWGNDPSSFGENFIHIVAENLGKIGNITVNEKKAFENYLWNFNRWTFVAPITPCTIFLDCRTRRHYDSLDGPPQLLNEEELQSISEAAYSNANYKKGDVLIMISPTPVLGFDLAEDLQKYLASKSSVYKWDLETWAANERGFVRFIKFIIEALGPRHCIFLSGDVHYGFTISATFTLLSQENGYTRLEKGPSLQISQLNSSALKTTSMMKELILGEVFGRARQFFSSRHFVRVGWNTMPSKSQKLNLKDNSSGRNNDCQIIIDGIKFDNKIKGSSDSTPAVIKTSYSSSLSLLRPSPPPDWIESRSIVAASGPGISSLVISDNNLGWMTIEEDKNKITHRLLVRKEKKATRIYEAVMEMKKKSNCHQLISEDCLSSSSEITDKRDQLGNK